MYRLTDSTDCLLVQVACASVVNGAYVVPF